MRALSTKKNSSWCLLFICFATVATAQGFDGRGVYVEGGAIRTDHVGNNPYPLMHYWIQINDNGPHTIRAVMWENGAVSVPGSWTVTLQANANLAHNTVTDTVSIQDAGWQTWVLPQPVPFLEALLDFMPVDGGEADFVNFTLPDSLDYEEHPGTAWMRVEEIFQVFPGDFAGGSLLLVTGEPDTTATPACQLAGATRIIGLPYDRIDLVSIPDGGSLIQSTYNVTPNPLDLFSWQYVKDVFVPLGNPPPAQAAFAFSQPLGFSSSTGSLTYVPPSIGSAGKWTAPFFGTLPPVSGGTVNLALHTTSGAQGWYRLGTTPSSGDDCDPVARATWGGTQAHADDLLGADYMFFFESCSAPISAYEDLDHDSYGNPSSRRQVCADAVPAGLVLNGTDCDDTRADVAPGRAEVCDGVDNNCDGHVDANDPALQLKLCGPEVGVCVGVTHVAAECIAGAWTAACANLANVPYETPETTCDGLDNDCDGLADNISGDGPLCGTQLGVCAGLHLHFCAPAGSPCTSDVLPISYQRVENTCDGLDNDCNGLVDGDDPGLVPPACERTVGVCFGSVHARNECTMTGWSACDAHDYGDSFEPVETKCDGLDNDCDGVVDEGCSGMKSGCGCSSGQSTILVLALAALRLAMKQRRRAAL
jgi:hypothetical protein